MWVVVQPAFQYTLGYRSCERGCNCSPDYYEVLSDSQEHMDAIWSDEPSNLPMYLLYKHTVNQ